MRGPPSYTAFPGSGSSWEWGVAFGDSVVYDALCGFDEAAAKTAATIMNAGMGLDGWCESEKPNADLLRDRLLERGWVDPFAKEFGHTETTTSDYG